MFVPEILISPSILTPSIKSFSLLRHRSNVDLPQPDGPIKAVDLLAYISKVTSFKALAFP